MKVRLEGFRELDRALSELPKATGKGVLRRIARGALEPMAADATAKAPVATGKLAFHVGISEKRTRRARSAPARVFVDGKWRSDPATGIDMAMGPVAGQGVLSYATWVEFGTADTTPEPYMRPAWDSGAARALDYIKDHLGAAIRKAAARVAKRRLKTGG
jgi:HK97 gp10 family phage protein